MSVPFLVKATAGVKWLGQFMLMIVATLGTPFVMLLVLPFLKRDTTNVLPKALQFLNTYDDLGSDQGMYETQVKWVYDHFGWYVKTWYWLGLRNQCYTLFFWLAPVIDFQKASFTSDGSSYFLEQGNSVYFDFVWTGNWSSTKKWTITLGWKLRSISDLIRTNKGTDRDRPTFDFQIRPWSKR